MPPKNTLKVVQKPGFSRVAYLHAKVLDTLASNCHEQHLLFRSLGQAEMADAFAGASNGLHDQARILFPLYPHPEFVAGWKGARANGFDEYIEKE